jgi:hypothetical protein
MATSVRKPTWRRSLICSAIARIRCLMHSLHAGLLAVPHRVRRDVSVHRAGQRHHSRAKPRYSCSSVFLDSRPHRSWVSDLSGTRYREKLHSISQFLDLYARCRSDPPVSPLLMLFAVTSFRRACASRSRTRTWSRTASTRVSI